MGYVNLVFDADDTLWECTVLFERVVEGFVRYLDHPTLSREQVRAELTECERATIAVHGYGAGPFERSLADCLARVRPDTPVCDADRTALRDLCAPIRESEVELLEGVPETLRALGERHRLFLLTKGDLDDQRRKIERSGLAEMFHGIDIVPEKDPASGRNYAVIVPAVASALGSLVAIVVALTAR
jgi:putative hydrolase of the HAD superfamily